MCKKKNSATVADGLPWKTVGEWTNHYSRRLDCELKQHFLNLLSPLVSRYFRRNREVTAELIQTLSATVRQYFYCQITIEHKDEEEELKSDVEKRGKN